MRGFKDSARSDIDRYAGTRSKCSHKVFVSEAVRRGWDICTINISKAFLQGGYEELAALAGEPERGVNFDLPSASSALLHRVPDFETFDPHTEVLRCDKTGPELVDAPRAFSIKLRIVTENVCKLIPSAVDPEL